MNNLRRGIIRSFGSFWTHLEIIPVGQFFRRWIKSINQSINQKWQQIPTTMVAALWSKSFRLIDWLIDDKVNFDLIGLVKSYHTICFYGAGLKWPNTAGQIQYFRRCWTHFGRKDVCNSSLMLLHANNALSKKALRKLPKPRKISLSNRE